MIILENINFSYGEKEVLNNFSLKINEDECVCLFGPNGSGKSTILRLLLGLEKPASGKISGISDKRISTVFQENRLLPFKTIRQNLALVGASEKSISETLASLNLTEQADKYPRELSGGMKRRAAIARALSVDFDLLILDEPLTGLDSENLDNATNRVLEKSAGKPIVLVTHSLDEAKLFNARIVNIA